MTMPSLLSLFFKQEAILPAVHEALDFIPGPPQKIRLGGGGLSPKETKEHLAPSPHKLCGQQSPIDVSRGLKWSLM